MPRTKKSVQTKRKPRKAGGGWFDLGSWFSSKPADTGAASTGVVGKVPAVTGDVGTETASTGVVGTETVDKVQPGGKGRKSRKNRKKSVKGKSKK